MLNSKQLKESITIFNSYSADMLCRSEEWLAEIVAMQDTFPLDAEVGKLIREFLENNILENMPLHLDSWKNKDLKALYEIQYLLAYQALAGKYGVSFLELDDSDFFKKGFLNVI